MLPGAAGFNSSRYRRMRICVYLFVWNFTSKYTENGGFLLVIKSSNAHDICNMHNLPEIVGLQTLGEPANGNCAGEQDRVGYGLDWKRDKMAEQKPTSKKPAQGGSRIGDILFWLTVLALGGVAAVLVTLALWDGWQSATAEPTVMVFSRESTTPPPTGSPTPESLDLALDLPAPAPVDSQAQPGEFIPEPTSAGPAASPPPMPEEVVGGSSSGLTSLRDDFSTQQWGWSARATESSLRGYEGGAYFIETNAEDVYALSFVPVEFLPVEFRFEAAAVTAAGGGTFGLLCQYVDESSFYLVEFEPQRGEVALGKRSGGEYQSLSEPEWQPLQGFDSGAGAINRVSILCSPERLQVSVNGGESRSVEILNPLTGARRAALFTAGNEGVPTSGFRVYWDNFSAWAAAAP